MIEGQGSWRVEDTFLKVVAEIDFIRTWDYNLKIET